MNLLWESSSSSDEEIRRPKVYRTRNKYFEQYDDVYFFERFRLTKPTVLHILDQLENRLACTNRGGAIQPMEQLLLTLRFYASGNFLITSGDFIGVSKASACRIVKRVSSCIASLRPRYINMYEDINEMKIAAEQFYQIARFPKVIGAIDCTLIKIESPGGEDAEIFRSRKNFFAYNVQTVSDANLKIIDIVARWPGSTHDQTVFNNSLIKRKFENGSYRSFLLLGDSGYTLQPYLMTKLAETQNQAENLYNESLIRTRNVVERSYGVWKRRFPILSLGMRLKQDTALCVIIATAILHNIAIEFRGNIPDDWLQNDDEEDNLQEINGNQERNSGRQIRQMLINEHFSNL